MHSNSPLACFRKNRHENHAATPPPPHQGLHLRKKSDKSAVCERKKKGAGHRARLISARSAFGFSLARLIFAIGLLVVFARDWRAEISHSRFRDLGRHGSLFIMRGLEIIQLSGFEVKGKMDKGVCYKLMVFSTFRPIRSVQIICDRDKKNRKSNGYESKRASPVDILIE